MIKKDLNELRIDYLIERYSQFVLRDSNIVGVGRGNKIINDNMTNIPTLTFIVKKKVDKSQLGFFNIIPKNIKGVFTDVIEGGIPSICRNEARPALGGMSIGPVDVDLCGTIAYAVTDRKTKKNLMILTCCHILDLLLKPKIFKTKVMQPCKGQGGDAKSSIIGSVINYVQISTDSESYNEVDAAVIFVGNNDEGTRKKLVDGGLKNGTLVENIIKANVGDAPMWIGASTGRLQGIGSKILTVNTTCKIDVFEDKNPKRFINFKNQVVCSFSANNGDSGALGIMQVTNKAFGMLMASANNMSYFNDIETVLDKLDIELVKL